MAVQENIMWNTIGAEVEFVHPVSAGGSVKFLPVVFFVLKLLKLSEIDGVKFLA